MSPNETPSPNPRRVAAGRKNRSKRRGLTAEGLDRLRQAANKNQPWRFSTGPRTSAGKLRSAANGKLRQVGTRSVREFRAEFAGVRQLLATLQELRQEIERS